jgi:hypothetical protein
VFTDAPDSHDGPHRAAGARRDGGVVNHSTIPVQVWADVDRGIAPLVAELNTWPTVRTHASCEGGESYGPYVMATWSDDDTLRRLLQRFDVTLLGNYWGHVHPRSYT